MASFTGKFDSVRQDWETPTALYVEMNNEFNFTLDAAAADHNTKCDLYFTEVDDSMTKSWAPHTVWLNPPYGKGYSLAQWVKKSHAESLLGATVVMLIPARTNTNWFHEYCLRYGEVRFIKGRPKFGGADHGLPQPLCFIIFRPNG